MATRYFLPVVWIPEENFDSFLMLFHLIYLGKNDRTREYSERFPERLHLLVSDSFTFPPHRTPCHPPSKPFLGEIRKATQRLWIPQHGELYSNERRTKDLLTVRVCLNFLEPSWSLPGWVSVLWCLWAGWRWPWSGGEQKNPQGKYRMWQKTELVNQGWAGLHCVKSARVLEGCGQEMALLSQRRGPCPVSQDPRQTHLGAQT